MTDVFIALGSNLGHRIRYLSRALHEIADLPDTNVIEVSRAYESEPWGVEDQPPFANAVALVRTTFRADQLLESLLQIEDRLGRTRETPHGPRTIDLDILLFGDEEWDTPELVVPHPRMAVRDFVITPLLEIAPDATWPDGSPITRERVSVGRITQDLGPIPDPGLAEGQPITTEDWVTIAEGASTPPDMGLRFKEMVLEQAHIPFTWDPQPPDAEYQPFGLAIPIRLRVPAGHEARARELLAQAEEAPVLEEDMAAIQGSGAAGPAASSEAGTSEDASLELDWPHAGE